MRIGATRGLGQSLFLGVICAVLGTVHGLRVADHPVELCLPAGSRALVAEWHTRFEDTGPLFRNDIRVAEQLEFRAALPDTFRLVPLKSQNTALTTTDGRSVGLRVAYSNAEVIPLLNPQHRDAAGYPGCDEGTLYLPRPAQERLGLSSGERIRLGNDTVTLGEAIPPAVLRAIPAEAGTDAFACVSHDHPALARIDRFVMLFPQSTSDADIGARFDRLASVDRAFLNSWVALPMQAYAEMAARRRVGWLAGLEALLALLAVGTAVLSCFMSVLDRSHDASIRRALGEAEIHRIGCALRKAGGTLAMAVPVALTFVLAASHVHATRYAPENAEDFTTPAVAATLRYALMLSLTIAILHWLLEKMLVRKSQLVTLTRVTRPTRSISLVTALASLMCAGICLPTVFLCSEFVRHGGMSSGYETTDLASIRLTLLNHENHSQQEWWDRIVSLRNELSGIAGISAVGFINPAPWDYDGTPGVIDGDDQMLLNVAVTEGTLGLLAPPGRIGADIRDDAEGLSYVLQGVDEQERRLFLPSGATVVGELKAVRFSPLDETGRDATVRSLRAGIGNTVSVVIKANDLRLVRERVDAVLARQSEFFAPGPLRKVDEILAERLEPVRTSAIVSAAVAGVAVVLMAVVLLATIRLYMLANRRELAIKLCLGASPGHLALRLTLACAVVTAAGWLLGTGVGLVIWHQVVAMIGDHRLVQPLSSAWLLAAALVMIVPYYLTLAMRNVRRTDITAVLHS